MALKNNRLKTNQAGAFYVDSSCIDCGSCWQIDPKHFARKENNSYVHTQPNGKKEVHKALLALLDCPVAAIGIQEKISEVLSNDIFPILVYKHLSGDVYYCGWSSKRSYGASSWLILRPEGNILIDSPRWSPPLAREIRRMGGVSQMFLTHRDDVADHALWAKAFNCERWIHKEDADAAPEAEKLVLGIDPLLIGKTLKLIPSPGHTAGSIVILLGEHRQILFSGDHLWWNPEKEVLVASKRYCWWNWSEQLKSVQRLLDLDVKWLLPGHGHAHMFKKGEWKKALEKTLRFHKIITD